MSVSSTLRKQQFVLNGVTAAFTFTFRALTSAPTDIKCKVTLAGVETALTYTTNYTAAINSNGIGGTVTLVSPSATGLGTLTVYRETTNTQGSDYDDYNQFPADTVETDFDIRTLVSQEQSETLDRSLRLPISATGASTELPVPAADKVLGWDSAGTALENKTFTPSTSLEKANAADADAGTNDAKYMTPTMTTIAIKSFAATVSTLVLAPATNTANSVPQWDGANSRKLKDGLAVGTSANNLMQLDASAKLPAVDGSALTGGVAIETSWADYFATSTKVGWVTPSGNIYYKKIGNIVFVLFDITGTSNSISTSFTLPYTNGDVQSATFIYSVDNSVLSVNPAWISIAAGSAIATAIYTLTNVTWTASGTKQITGQFWYRTA